MLNGLWAVDIADERGGRADGLVTFRDGAVLGDSSSIDIDGSYEVEGDAFLAGIDVVLHGTGWSGESMAEIVHLHVQGRRIGRAITASGIDLADDTRRVRIYMEQRTAIPAAARAEGKGVSEVVTAGDRDHARD